MDDDLGLTDEQARPLRVRGASVALSAGAGCGKTTVLTARFLKSLGGPPDDRRPLRSLVALTFTEKAASELRDRIRHRCHERLVGARGEEVAHWRSILRGLEAAPVSTFHEYCTRLLRRHAASAGIDPDFQVLDEAIAASVLDESLARCVRRWLADTNEDLIELAVEYTLPRVREALGELVKGQSPRDLAAWAGRTEDEVVAVWRAAWEREGPQTLVRPVHKAARACSHWLTANDLDHPKLVKFRSELRVALQDVETTTDAERLKSLREQANVPRGLRSHDWPSPEVNEEAKAVLKSLRDAIDKFIRMCEPDEATTRRCAALGLRFARLASHARGAYDEAKADRGGLDFDDLLVKARDLLEHDADVRAAEEKATEFVLVDEFQDTDPVQSQVLKELCGEAFSTGRLFVVGDFKQSIYRFRGARPKLFQEYRAAFPVEGRHDLTANFRSTTGVIDFVNALSEDSKKPDVDTQRKTEARWLARLIRTKIDAGWMIRDRDSKDGAIRRAHPGDVAFLFRSMTDLKEYEKALQVEGLDFHVVGGKAFYAQQEVEDLVNVLSVVEDPLDAVALAGALRGPFFGLSDNALFRLGGDESTRGDLPGGLARFEDIAALSSDDRLRAARARDLLERWRGLKDRVPIAALVDRVLDESGFEAALLGEFLGDRKRANARKLVRLARRFDARGGFTLGHFVHRLRADLLKPPREDQAATTDEVGESVRLMSIHQSKGLEFPIVVVPDLNRKSPGGSKLVAFDPDLGPLVRPGDAVIEGQEGDAPDDEGGSGKSLGRVIHEAVEREEEDAESLRLFYVATTRARDALILSAGVGPEAKPASTALRLLAERFDRRTGACRCVSQLPAGWGVPEVQVTTACYPSAAGSHRVRRRKPRLDAVAKLIHRTRPIEAPAAIRPRFVDLDECRGLSPRASRLDRLIRSILADPRALLGGRDALAEAARIAAPRQEPLAHHDLVSEAVALLGRVVEGRIGAGLARAPAVERGMAWTMVWPPDSSDSTVWRGRTEFFARDDAGTWRAVVFSLPGANEAVERLRLLLSARAADALGFGPVVKGWRVRPGGVSLSETSFDDRAIDEAVRAVLDLAIAPIG